MLHRYQTFCSKYGRIPYRAIAYGPLGIIAALYYYGQSASALTLFVGQAVMLACNNEIEEFLPVLMRRRGIGMKRGSKILQRTQLGSALGITAAFSLAAAYMLEVKPKSPQVRAHQTHYRPVAPAQ